MKLLKNIIVGIAILWFAWVFLLQRLGELLFFLDAPPALQIIIIIAIIAIIRLKWVDKNDRRY